MDGAGTDDAGRGAPRGGQLRGPPADTGPDALTHRELDVLDAMAAGLCDKEIAVQLGISFNTVRTHIGHIYEKLHVQGRMQAVKVARRWWR